jgi:hypothetical protein
MDRAKTGNGPEAMRRRGEVGFPIVDLSIKG